MSTPGGPIEESSDPMREVDAERDALESAYRFLMANREGVLCFEDHHVPVRFVTDGSTGRLVMGVPVATFFASEHVLWIPEERDDAMQILLSPEQIDEGAATDRWMAFHGEPEHVRWAMCWVDSARQGAWVFDGEALTRPNTLAGSEAALIKAINADKAALARMCEKSCGARVEEPVCVGVDQDGLHVRARFGVVRVALPHTANDAEHARGMIAALASES